MGSDYDVGMQLTNPITMQPSLSRRSIPIPCCSSAWSPWLVERWSGGGGGVGMIDVVVLMMMIYKIKVESDMMFQKSRQTNNTKMFVLVSRGDRYDGNQPLHSAVITISSTYLNLYRSCGRMEPAAGAVLLDSRSG